MQPVKLFHPIAAIAFSAAIFSLSAPAQNSYVNFEGKQTSPTRLSADGTRLFAGNTPDARLSVFDVSRPSSPFLIAEIPVGVEPVSVNPRTSDEVWVVNEVSDSISVVSISQRLVTDTLYVKDEPADVVFAGGRAFVTTSRNNQVVVFDATSHAQLAVIPLFGENPRALVVNTNGTKVYAAFALSGNHTTLIPYTNAPPQPPPTNTNLPAPPQVGLIVDATNSAYYPSVIKYTMPDNDVAEIDVSSLTVTRYFPHVGTVNLGIAVRPGGGDLYVANTDARNLVHFEPGVRGHVVDNRVTRISISSGTVTPYDLNAGFDYSVLPNLSALSNALAQPTAIAFDPSGSFFYLAAFGSDRIAKVDADNPTNILARVELCPTAIGSATDSRNKRGPRGLALNASANVLYVLNRIANTISIVDTVANSVTKEIPVGSFDPTPAVIRNGRGFLYDSKLSGNGTMACAACHIDAEMDLIAWDLGDPGGQMATNTTVLPAAPPFFGVTNTSVFHPMKGPMVTQTLRGLNTLDPFHWRGDRTNFAHFNIAFPALLGSTSLSSNDMAAYSNFINTVAFEPNPNQNLDRTYPTSFAGGNPSNGSILFTTTNYAGVPGLVCSTCHTAPPGPGSDRVIIPATFLQEPQDFKVPQLRSVYQKTHFTNTPSASTIGGYGFTHDGAIPSLQTFLSQPVFAAIRNNTAVKNDLSAFLQCFDTGTAPAVGYTRTATAANVNSLSLSNDWNLLESQAALSNIDLIVKGTISGKFHGLLYQPALGTYRVDSVQMAALTRAQLETKILASDTLTLMGVPPGSGLRMGIDRNQDGVLDGDTPPPMLNITQSNGQTLISWPYSAAGFSLESSSSLSLPNWTTVSNAVEISSGQNIVTNTPGAGAQFYRLHYQ